MQCGCPECGLLMAQTVRGLESACRCPNCGYACKACLGTNSVVGKEELAHSLRMAELASLYGLREDEKNNK